MMDALEEATQAQFARRVEPLVSAEIIEEHRRQPFGPHSPELATVLRYLRRPMDGRYPRYVLRCDQRAERWDVLEVRRGERNAELLHVDDQYSSQEEAEHAVFRRRLADRGLWPPRDTPDWRQE